MSPPGLTSKLNLLTSAAETKLCFATLSTKATAEEAASPQDSVHIPLHADAGTGFQLALSKQEQLSKHLPSTPHALWTRTGNLNKCAVEEATERLPGKNDGLGCKTEPYFFVLEHRSFQFEPRIEFGSRLVVCYQLASRSHGTPVWIVLCPLIPGTRHWMGLMSTVVAKPYAALTTVQNYRPVLPHNSIRGHHYSDMSAASTQTCILLHM